MNNSNLKTPKKILKKKQKFLFKKTHTSTRVSGSATYWEHPDLKKIKKKKNIYIYIYVYLS